MRIVWHAILLALLGFAPPLLAQRPLCGELPAADRDRARASGLCRDPAPIIDVLPRAPDTERPAESAASTQLSVPNVIGAKFDDARGRLTSFTLQRTYRAAAEPGGTVLAQSPMSPATLPAGAPVSLVLSDGSLVRVPSVTGININEARQQLAKEPDLKAQPVVVTSDMRVGTVLEQQPAEGTLVKRGSVVRLQVSAGAEGPEQLDVPNVVGMPLERARSRLTRFTVERLERPREEQSSDAPVGQVIEQLPRAATRAAAGSVIVLTVSAAPRATVEVFEMPGVVGRMYTDAARSLAEFKISRSETSSEEARGSVVAQTPAAGTTLLPGATVTLQVSAGPAASSKAAADVAAAAAGTSAGTSAAPAAEGGRSVLRGVVAIGAAVVLGLVFGALLMRQWLLRRRATKMVDDAIDSMTPMPSTVTTVDILLDPEPARPGEAVAVKPTPEDPREIDLESSSEEAKHHGP